MNRYIALLTLAMFALALNQVSAQPECTLDVVLANQDPIHAVPGEYVKFVFQLSGLQNPACGDAVFKIAQAYPFTLDPGTSDTTVFQAGTYAYSYSSVVAIPYTVRVDSLAIDENYTLKVQYGAVSSDYLITKEFNISVKNVKADFDVFVQDYDPVTHIATIDVLNTGENNIEALTAEITSGHNLAIKGSLKSVIGALDASQDATFTIEIAPIAAQIPLTLAYTDEDGTRRTTSAVVDFDPSYFTGRQGESSGGPSGIVITIIVIVIIVAAYLVWRRISRRRQEKKHSQRNL